VLNNYCSVVNCQTRRRTCLCKAFFGLHCQHKQLQTSPSIARRLPRSTYERGNST